MKIHRILSLDLQKIRHMYMVRVPAIINVADEGATGRPSVGLVMAPSALRVTVLLALPVEDHSVDEACLLAVAVAVAATNGVETSGQK
jgi:hypothetical protein